ncbi:MAG TPA: alpha/beta hydrolase [Methanocella sp.]|nr:alpha/beta hydrolase [Methanocella sp.]
MSTEIMVSPIRGVDPVVKTFLDKINSTRGPQIYQMSPGEARAALLKIQNVKVPELVTDTEDLSIPDGPKGAVQIRIIRPKGAEEKLAAIMYFHGGGWVLGDKNTHDRLVREISTRTNSAVIFVDYSRSPEAMYPIAVEECYIATRYVAQNAEQLNIDPSRLIVAGDSVGGNMATVVSMMAKQRKRPKIGMQILFYPVTDSNFDTSSYRQYANGYWLSREAMKWFWDQYLPEKSKRSEPMASPLQASADQLLGLPEALVITDEFDVLRDEGEAYARKLIESGVKVAAIRCLGTIHDFMMLNALSRAPATRCAIDLACDMIKSFGAVG